MAKEKHYLDQLAIQWKHQREEFFLDVDFSNEYVQVDTPVGTKHAWQIKEQNTSASKNLESIFESKYRNEKHNKIVAFYEMLIELFGDGLFPPAELDLGRVILYPGAKLTDVISGLSSSLSDHGWLISKKFFALLQNFNIGEYRTYKITVQNKKQLSDDYVYLRYYSFADQFVDYSKSKFYTKDKSSFDLNSSELISINSFEEIDKKRNELNDGLGYFESPNYISILPKELFLKNNNLDLFKFKNLRTGNCFMSAKLAKAIYDEKITGFELFKTTKVKDVSFDKK
jgi:hypothetical protein